MSLHKIELTIDIDDEALAEWIPESEMKGGPYTKNVSEWDASDVFRAADYSIIDPGECDFAYVEKVSS